MVEFLAVITSGIVSGSTYALLALGLVIIFRSTDTINFAIGDIATAAVYVASMAIKMGVPVFLGLPIAFVGAGLIGVAAERLLIRPLGHGHRVLFVALVVTIGLGLLIHAGALFIWGAKPSNFPAVIAGSFHILGITLTWNRLLAASLAGALMISVAWFFRVTPIGMSMRAAAEDGFAARLIGINTSRVSATSWFVGCGLAAVSAFFLAADTSLSVNLTVGPLFRAFAGVFLGGMTSLPGAAVGGFAIGVLDNIAGRYISASFRDTIVFATIVAILFIRPSGFLGIARKERV